MPARHLARAALGSAILVLGFAAGCVVPGDDGGRASGDSARLDLGPTSAPTRELRERLTVFAREAFYLERPEPEQSFRGVLRRVEVRVGPNTREMPLLFDIGGEDLPVYVSGLDLTPFLPFVGRQVEVIGKRVDLASEDAGVEIWIGTLALDRP